MLGILIGMFLAGAIFFLGAMTLSIEGATGYRARFVSTLGSELRTGFSTLNPEILLYGSIVLAAALAVMGWAVFGWPGAVIGIVAGVATPWYGVRFYRKRRTRNFIYQLPDALNALASSMRSGTSVSRGLELIAARQPAPLSQEFALVLAEHRLGRDIEDAMGDLYSRMPCQEVTLLVTAIAVSRRVGGDLASTLETLASGLYQKAQIEGKIQSLTAMGRAQGWVVCLLPVAVGWALFQQQPENMQLLFETWYGIVTVAIISVMMFLAVRMIRSIVNIDV